MIYFAVVDFIEIIIQNAFIFLMIQIFLNFGTTWYSTIMHKGAVMIIW